MIKVFRVKNNVNHFQYFLTEKQEDAIKLRMDGTPKSHFWSPPPVFVYQPKLQKGDFYNFNSDILISSPKATEMLYLKFVEAGELLPLPYEDETYTVLNVTECINCLDKDKTKWRYEEETNVRLMIEKYVFHSDRFSESSIFKIPETSRSELLIVEGLKDPEDELRYNLKKAGLVGLIFELIWES